MKSFEDQKDDAQGANKLGTIVVTQYPISNEYRDYIVEKIGGTFTQLTISTIVASGQFNLIRYLYSLKCSQVVVFVPNPNHDTFADALYLIAALIRGEATFLLMPGSGLQRISMARVLLAAMKISVTLNISILFAVLTWFRTLWLSRQPRIKTSSSVLDHSKIYYVKMTLWLGVQVGGAVAHAHGIVKSFADQGVEASIFTTEDLEFEGLKKDFNIFGISVPFPYITPRELNHVLMHYWALFRVKKKIETGKGFIYQRLSVGNFVGVELSRMHKIPLVVEYNGSETWLSENWGTPYLFRSLIDQIENTMLSHAHLIVTVSAPLRQQLVDRGFSENRIIVAPNGFDPKSYTDDLLVDSSLALLRDKMHVGPDTVVLTFVGTFGPWHGVEIFARAAVEYLEDAAAGKASKDVCFLFIGDGARKKTVEDILRSYIGDPRIIMTGMIPSDEVAPCLAASDVCVLPIRRNFDGSDFFGSPTKLFEYMAAGKPVIASCEGQVKEVLAGSPHISEFDSAADKNDKSQVGVLIDADNIGQLREAITKVVDNRDWRRAAGQNARQRALNKHTWSKSTDLIHENLIRVVKNDALGRIRVLINGLHSKAGGGVTYLRNMLSQFKECEELDVHVLLNMNQNDLFREYLDGVTCHFVSGKRGMWATALLEQTYGAWIPWHLKANVTFSPANFGPIFSCRPVILLRNALGVRKVEARLLKRLYWLVLSIATVLSVLGARRVIAVSSYALSSVPRSVRDIRKKDISIISHGVSPVFTPGNFPDRHENRLLFVSDLYVQKNLHRLIAAISEINRHFDVSLDVVGAHVDIEYTREIQQQIIDLGLKDKIRLYGHMSQNDLNHMYQSCTVFVFPSTVETFGNPLVEAMACGAPVACSNTAAMPEVADNAAVFFDPINVNDIVRVIEKLLSDRELRLSLSKLAVARAQNFSWNHTMQKTLNVLIDAADS